MLVKKLGQPVPLSNFISELNSGSAQPAQTKIPTRFSSLSGLLKGRSVASLRRTKNCASDKLCFHSPSVFCNGATERATSAFLASSVGQSCWIASIDLALGLPAAKARPAAALAAKTTVPNKKLRLCTIPPSVALSWGGCTDSVISRPAMPIAYANSPGLGPISAKLTPRGGRQLAADG